MRHRAGPAAPSVAISRPARSGRSGGRRRAQPTPEQRRSRLLVALAPASAALIVAAVLIAVYAHHEAESSTTAGHAVVAVSVASPQVVTQLTTVPAATFDQIGRGSIVVHPKPVDGPALTAGGLPRVLFVGAEWCPYCAAERWALVVALARFGTFRGLGQTASSLTEAFPGTATLSFHGATFTSSTLSFTGKEVFSNRPTGGSYAPLDTLDPSDTALFQGVGQGTFPFIDFGGRYVISGSSFDPQVLHGLSSEQIAGALADPTAAVARAVDGTANVMTAAICSITDGTPAAVCTASGVVAGKADLNG